MRGCKRWSALRQGEPGACARKRPSAPLTASRLYHNPPFFIELLRATEDNRADDALMVDQGVISRLDNLHFRC